MAGVSDGFLFHDFRITKILISLVQRILLLLLVFINVSTRVGAVIFQSFVNAQIVKIIRVFFSS